MQKLISRTFLIVSFQTMFGCGYFVGEQKTIKIPNISEGWEENVTVTIPDGKNVYKLTVKISGEIQEKCLINGKELEPGHINAILKNGDYYTNSYSIKYDPLNNKEGDLDVELTFYYN